MVLGLSPRLALLNDANEHLINFYSWLQRGLVTKIQMRNSEALYYRQRKRFNKLLLAGRARSAEAAALFYFLNRTGYNGLCRFNKQGQFNVPFGRYKNISYTCDFSEYSDQFQNWEFTTGDFASIPLRPTDFVYADPPYDVEFTAYSQGGFSWQDQVRTAESLATHKGPVVVVNQATERIVKLYHSLGYKVRFMDAPRRINCTGDRTPAKEILATRNL